ncbi:MAG: OmpA family protein [Treponema sp.]|nr:OmpA family protein [Treponema sp.]
MKNSILKGIFVIVLFPVFIAGIYAQTEYDFPAGDFWSLNLGLGMTNFGVDGTPFQLVIEPRLWLSPPLMVGAKTGITYSIEDNTSAFSNILTIEGQVYLRWNFLRPGSNPLRRTNIFVQGGLGLIAAYRGDERIIDNPRITRGSLMADSALGIAVPLFDRWTIEASGRFGYPHIWGGSITAGLKFPLPEKIITDTRVDIIEIDRALPSHEAVSRIIIPAIEFVLFGPDIGSYNVGIDTDARQLNELVLNAITRMLSEDSGLRVRIEGHANPHTINQSEADDLMALSVMRANVVADQLRARGVSDEQIVLVAFGGTRTATNEWDVRNRNRRVELMIIQFDTN